MSDAFSDQAPPSPPPLAQMPQAPSPGAMTQQSIQARIDADPQIMALIQKDTPQYAQMLTDIQGAQVPKQAQQALDLNKKFSGQYIQQALDNLKQADPTGFQVRETLGNKVLEELKSGGALSPEEQTAFDNDIGAEQAKRGVGTGFRDALDASSIMAGQRFGRNQARIGNAENFLAGKSPSSTANTGLSLMTGPNVAPFAMENFSGLTPSTSSLNAGQMNAWNTGVNFTGQNNMLENNRYQYMNDNTEMGPALQGLSAFGGFAGQIMGGSGGSMAAAAMA